MPLFPSTVPPPEHVGLLAIRRFGSGRPLVLLHGGVGSWNHWIANVERLARAFAVIAVDLPGYGDAADARTDEPNGYIEDVATGLMQAVASEAPFDIAGFSFGSVIASGIVRKFSHRIRRLSLLGPGGFGLPVGRNVTLVSVPDPTVDFPAHRKAVAYNLGEFMLSRVPATDDPVVDLQSANIARMRFDSRKISFYVRMLDELAGSTCPLQFIWGAGDRLAQPSIAGRAEQCSAVRPDAQIHMIADAGHWVQYEAPRTVEDLLVAFHKQASP
jgi:2-hydroxy-6-oxonona-2,4-dienedioate hydrolase